MKKVILVTFTILAVFVAGCAPKQENTAENSDVSSVSTTTAEPAAETTEIPTETEEDCSDMLERSLTSIGNTARLQAKMEQAKRGEKTVVAYLGGSITEGYAGGPDGCYAKLSYDYFAETYGTGDNVEYVNAGLSGTASTLGNLRLQRDVLAYKPDIVFVEYAVNDGQDLFTKSSYESLVKTILMQENEPAVVLLFNRTVDGYSAQKYMKVIGAHYALPMISAADAITAEIDEGRMKWEDYSVDAAHPSKDGHQLICDMIAYMYRKAENTPAEPYELPVDKVYNTRYANAVMSTLTTHTEEISVTDHGSFVTKEIAGGGFSGYWEYNPAADGGTEPLKLTARGSVFFLMYKTNNTDQMASVDVYINGEFVKTVDSKEEYGWGGAAAAVVAEYDEVQDMEIEIRPAADDTKEKTFTLYGFAVS